MEEPNKIYIGNLEFGLSEEDLRNTMNNKGINPKEVKIIKDKLSGRSKGFGFAEFETEEETQAAIDALNGQDINGRTVQVNKARKMQPRRNFGPGGSSGGNFRR